MFKHKAPMYDKLDISFHIFWVGCTSALLVQYQIVPSSYFNMRKDLVPTGTFCPHLSCRCADSIDLECQAR